MKTVWAIVVQAVCLHLVSGAKANVAQDKPANQSSTHGTGHGAEKGVDGTFDTIIHTGLWKQYAGWMVDLQQQVQNATVEIYFRRKADILRRPGIQLFTSTSPFSKYPGGQWRYTFSGNVPDVATHTCSGTWRYLMIYTQRTQSGDAGPLLDFEEVIVWACPTGTYGPDCNMNCGDRRCAAYTSTCHHATGQCVEGCLPGWIGTDCRTACESGVTYGHNCESSCQQRNCQKTSSNCDINKGKCEGGCKPGWKKLDCTEVCVNDIYYGPNCSLPCEARHCANSFNCHYETGQCVGGCHPGWNGADCTNSCPAGTYGLNCTKLCHNRYCENSAADCDHQNGSCPTGCKAGWMDIDCTEACLLGNYGPNCKQSCSDRHCKNKNHECDIRTGFCPDACESGYTGQDCTIKCPDGTFGVNCTMCSDRQCKGSTVCPENGTCFDGCKDGWMLHTCTQAISDTSKKSVVPAVVGIVLVLIVVVTISTIFVIYKRKRTQRNEYRGNISTSVVSNEGNTTYANVSIVEKTVQYKYVSNAKQNQAERPESETEQEEEILDEAEPSPDRDYYNDSVDVIREVHVEDLAATITKIRNKPGGFEAEFYHLPSGFTAPYDDSQRPENSGKNKFRGYYPYDHNRVRLSLLPGVPGSDYINASLMQSQDGETNYIAAQAPKKLTVGDFWRMIWEHRCGRVIMLTGLVEDMRVKCYQYWADNETFETDHFKIEVKTTDIRANYTIRYIEVMSKKSEECQSVVQYHFTSWPDHGVPDTLALVHFIWMIRQTDRGREGPLLVHCSAGIGRTGTYIAVDSLLDQARGEGMVDVLGYVSVMRGQRKNMIQTKHQYECVFHCLVEMTKFGNTSMDVKNFTTSYSSRGMDSMVDRKTLRDLIQMTITEERKDNSGRHRVWVDGNQEFIVRSGPSLRLLNGYLMSVVPPRGLEKLLWKLVEENNVDSVIIISQLQVGLFGDKGSSKKYGDVTLTTADQSNMTPDLTMVTIQLKMKLAGNTHNVKVFQFDGSPTLDSMSSCLLNHAHLQRLSEEMSPVVIVHSETDQKSAASFCIMGNIQYEIMEDHRIDVIGHVRKFLTCFPTVTFTEREIEKIQDFAGKCIDMNEAAKTYANV